MIPKKFFLNKNLRGLTLIEVVVSAALLAIVALVLVTVMLQALTSLKTTRDRTNNGMSAAAQMESKRAESASGSTSSDFKISFGNGAYTDSVGGTIVTDSENTYREFVPNK